MLTAYNVKNKFLSQINPSTDTNWLEDAVWIDLVNPTAKEIETVEIFSGISLPNIQETEELEASSHYEVYQDGFQVNCSFLHRVENKLFKYKRCISLQRQLPHKPLCT